MRQHEPPKPQRKLQARRPSKLAPAKSRNRSDEQRREKRTRNMAVKRARSRRLGPAAPGALRAAHAAVEKEGAHERARALRWSASRTRGAQSLANDTGRRRGGQRRCGLGGSYAGMVRRATHSRGEAAETSRCHSGAVMMGMLLTQTPASYLVCVHGQALKTPRSPWPTKSSTSVEGARQASTPSV